MVDVGAMANQAAMGGGMGQQTAREVSVLLSANTGPYQKEMNKAAEATNTLADALVAVEKAYAGTLKFIGSGMMGIGASMQATATGAVWSAAQFEEAFARVAKTTGLQNQLPFAEAGSAMSDLAATFGIGDNALQQFENDIRALSTEIPVSVQELSHLADIAGTLGVESKNLVLFADTAAQLGAGINNLGSDQAIVGLSNLIGAFGDAETSVVNLGSSLADLSNKTRGNAGEMLQFSERLAGTAVQVGMTSEEVLGLGAAISAIGVMPELGASAMVQVITQMSRAVQQGGDDLRKLGQAMGLTSEEFTAMWEDQGATRVIQEFVRSLSTQGEKATVTLQRLGMSGVNVTQVFGGLAAQSHVLDESLDISDTAYEAGEAVEELAKIRFDTVIQSMKQFRQATAEVFRSLGQAFLVPLKLIFDTLTNLVNLFNQLPQPIKTLIGLFLGVGGAIVTAAGAFTLLVGSFHSFFLLLHSVPILLAGFQKLLVAIAGPSGAAGATTAITGLTAAFTRFAAILTNIPGTIGAAFATAGQILMAFAQQVKTMVIAGFISAQQGAIALAGILRAQLAAGAAVATGALAKLSAVLKTIIGYAVAETFAVMGTAAKAFGNAAAFLYARLAPLVSILGRVTFWLAGIAAAITIATKAFSWWNERNSEAVSSLHELAEATDMAIRDINRVAHAYELSAKDQFEFIEGTRELVSDLKDLDQEAAKSKLINYGMMLLAGGNDPEEVQEQVETLARLSGIVLEFEYKFVDITHGPGFDQRQREAGAGVGHLLEQFEEERSGPAIFRGQRREFKENLDEELSAILDVAETNRATAIANLIRIRQDLDEALHEGVIDLGIYRESLQQIDETDLLPTVDLSHDGVLGWIEKNVNPISEFVNREFWGVWERLGGTIPDAINAEQFFGGIDSADFKRQLGAIADDEAFQQTAEGKQFREAIASVTGEVDNFQEAVSNLDNDQIREVQEAFYDLGLEIADTAHAAATAVANYDTAIERTLASARLELSDEDFTRFESHLFENYPQQVGFQQALDEADRVLTRMMENGEGWSEDAEKYRRAIKSWGEEFSRIQIRDLEAEINALPAIEQVNRLRQELAALDMTKPSSAPIGEALQTNLNQAIERSQSEFRQLMDQYDRLLEQREQTTENHNERMERMEEDHNRRMSRMAEDNTRRMTRMEENHNKSIQDQRDQHTKRLEDINKAEEKALENRVEQQARAFNILERIQATPTADMGSLIDNMERQNQAMKEMSDGMEQLRGMGLDEEVMVELGFDDPKNFAQVRRMLEMSVRDPSLIDEVNKLWRERLDLSEAFVQESDTSDITEQFDEQRKNAQEQLEESIKRTQERYDQQVKDANETYARQIKDANDSYARQVDDAQKNYQRQMQDISDQLAKLGVENAETIDELIQRAMDSGLDGITARAELMKGVMSGIMASMRDDFANLEELADRAMLNSAARFAEATSGSKSGHRVTRREGTRRSNPYPDHLMRDTSFPDHLRRNKGGLVPDRIMMMNSGGLVPDPIHLNTGGLVPGVGDEDKIPALLTPGEFVLTKEQTASLRNYGALGSRGREPNGAMSQTDMVKAFTKALENASYGQSETHTYGPITVEAQDPNEMQRKLDQKRRLSKLAGGGDRG